MECGDIGTLSSIWPAPAPSHPLRLALPASGIRVVECNLSLAKRRTVGTRCVSDILELCAAPCYKGFVCLFTCLLADGGRYHLEGLLRKGCCGGATRRTNRDVQPLTIIEGSWLLCKCYTVFATPSLLAIGSFNNANVAFPSRVPLSWLHSPSQLVTRANHLYTTGLRSCACNPLTMPTTPTLHVPCYLAQP